MNEASLTFDELKHIQTNLMNALRRITKEIEKLNLVDSDPIDEYSNYLVENIMPVLNKINSLSAHIASNGKIDKDIFIKYPLKDGISELRNNIGEDYEMV